MIQLNTNKDKEMAPTCPLCHGIGQKVRKITVQHQVKQGFKVEGEQFFLCTTPECDVAYYTQNKKTIPQEQLINKIWLKEVPPPVSICYCANVTEDEILYHVAIAKCCSSLDDIKKHTGANTGHECLTKNPAGA
ncbi:NAD(P)H-nitrite reductase [Desulfosporosinus acidiphilus SJ4]|uniref:NAD(P)H-nitrite reductase n=2 Tax=Desulfosporosinus TaxID=79206 RepID=I4D6W1_DESAJ|nr:NAD(P)H-nitrite reductase [Desulfosporosinus acidiphilus SJ4]